MPDEYEKAHLARQERSKEEESKLLTSFNFDCYKTKEESKQPAKQVVSGTFEKKAFEKEKQLNNYNKEFEMLKQIKYKARLGRNNRVFYKQMSDSIFEQD